MFRISLGKCNDPLVSKFSSMLEQGTVQTGKAIKAGGKSYFVSPTLITTYQNKPRLGEVFKLYKKRMNNEWYLTNRQVCNERGSYSRTINPVGKKIYNAVSLGGQDAFIRREDGRYVQAKVANYPERIVTSAEIEKAIDYIKGYGAKENYTKLLRH